MLLTLTRICQVERPEGDREREREREREGEGERRKMFLPTPDVEQASHVAFVPRSCDLIHLQTALLFRLAALITCLCQIKLSPFSNPGNHLGGAVSRTGSCAGNLMIWLEIGVWFALLWCQLWHLSFVFLFCLVTIESCLASFHFAISVFVRTGIFLMYGKSSTVVSLCVIRFWWEY